MKKADNVLKKNLSNPAADGIQHSDLDDDAETTWPEEERDKDIFEILQGLIGEKTDFGPKSVDENIEKEEGDNKLDTAGKETYWDEVGAYFKSMGDTPVLTKSEEMALAQKIQQGKKALRIIIRLPLMKRVEQMVPQNNSNRRKIEEQGITRNKITETVMEIIRELAEQWQELTEGGDKKTRAELADTIKKEIGVKADRLKEFYKKITEIMQSAKRAENEMIKRNLRLVVNVAKRYLYRGLPMLDLIQEGNIGLMTAVGKFDCKKGFKFSTYATWWIRQAVTRAIINQRHTIRLPVHITELLHKIEKVEGELFQNFGRQPTVKEIAQKLGLPVQKVEEAIKSRKTVASYSLNTFVGDDNKSELGDFISDESALSPSDEAERKGNTAYVESVLNTLKSKEAEVIKMRFGLGEAGRKHTLEEIGGKFNVTREYIRQIEVKALKKLKHPLRRKMLKSIASEFSSVETEAEAEKSQVKKKN